MNSTQSGDDQSIGIDFSTNQTSCQNYVNYSVILRYVDVFHTMKKPMITLIGFRDGHLAPGCLLPGPGTSPRTLRLPSPPPALTPQPQSHPLSLPSSEVTAYRFNCWRVDCSPGSSLLWGRLFLGSHCQPWTGEQKSKIDIGD